MRSSGVSLPRSEEHTSELQSRRDLVCRLLLEKKKKKCLQHPQPSCEPPITTANRNRRTGDSKPGLRSLAMISGVFWGLEDLQTTFFFNDTATTEIYTLSLHDALPI